MENKPKRALWSEAFGEEPEAGAIPVEHLEKTAAFVGEDEERPAFRVLFEAVSHKGVQRIDPRPHVAGIQRDEDAQRTGKTQHDAETAEGWGA